MLNEDHDYYFTLIQDLDEGPWEVTKWEADFLASVMEYDPSALTQRQKEVLDDMCEKYGVNNAD